MSETWNTKWGTRRVRNDPPTLAEAFVAAACLTDDRQQQAEIAATLMGVPVAAALAEAGRLARDGRGTITVPAPSRDKARLRTVVIERRPSRRITPGGRPNDAGGLDRPAVASRLASGASLGVVRSR